jgi:hypothetical protein
MQQQLLLTAIALLAGAALLLWFLPTKKVDRSFQIRRPNGSTGASVSEGPMTPYETCGPMIHQAITTTKPYDEALKATSLAGFEIVSWDNVKSVNDNHIAAARTLAMRLNWWGTWYGGSLPDGGRVFVRVLNGRTDVAAFTVPKRPK